MMELVGLGGVAGAIARHLVSEHVETATYDTLAVNLLGSFLLGVVTTAPLPSAAALALGTGFCGAFTTFSTFAFETVRLGEEGFRRAAARNALGTLLGALLAVTVGLAVGRLL
ncbi:fluoride efflux transporter FluC [Halorarius litoreus]|uniref:fluoride efflux transporter FluC n=1 Tax=Halorarius litoreus TaxID=2962676 RepID=UPI0020CF46EE|nr:CrcB family protein [Halorarius litoreus]